MNRSFLTALLVALFAISCDDSEDSIPAIAMDISESDVTEDAISDELDDIGRIALNSEEAAGGRVSTIGDHRLNCSGTAITLSNVSADKTSGTITITFPPGGCADDFGNVRKGELVVSWSGGKWFRAGAFHSITPVNYFFNDIKIEGQRINTVTSVTGTLDDFTMEWELQASHTIRWPDNSVSSRLVKKLRRWNHVVNEDIIWILNPTLGSAIEGTTKRGNDYAVTIEQPLVYTRSCNISNKIYVPIGGVKVFTNLSNEPGFSINYGDLECDNELVVSMGGKTRTIVAGE
jgi:hypothetical protein